MHTAQRRRVVSVVGGRSATDALLHAAHRLGDELMLAGYRLCSGGRNGIMAAVSRGARESQAWSDGRIVGILPGLDDGDANPYCDIVIPTGLHLARNALVVSSADAVVALGGGSGTLSEIALAWQYDKPIVALDIGEGWSARLAGESLDENREGHILAALTVEAVMEQLRELLD
jgi:uncharacterized protein (TIGR00725 family)